MSYFICFFILWTLPLIRNVNKLISLFIHKYCQTIYMYVNGLCFVAMVIKAACMYCVAMETKKWDSKMFYS